MKTVEELRKLREKVQNLTQVRDGEGPQIIIGMGTCGIAAGAREVLMAIMEEIRKRNLNVIIKQTGCIGMCEKEVLVDIVLPGQPRITYGNVTPDKVAKLISEHIVNGRVVADWAIGKI
jgi:NADP-reducing hydrogenase subunit HndB